MYEVLNKDTTKFDFFSLIDSGKALLWLKKNNLAEVIQCILYFLKTGCQGPITSAFP